MIVHHLILRNKNKFAYAMMHTYLNLIECSDWIIVTCIVEHQVEVDTRSSIVRLCHPV